MVRFRKSKKLFLPLILILLFLIGLRLLRIDPIGFIGCKLSNGSYEKPAGPLGGPILNSYCVYTYHDGGKRCKSSSECEGDCMVSEETQLKHKGITSEYVGGFGKCESSNRFTGCYPGTLEDPILWCI